MPPPDVNGLVELTDGRNHVTKVRLGILSAYEIRCMSAVEITDPKSFAQDVPMAQGVIDPRMGSMDARIICGTCQIDSFKCNTGHPGHIEMPFPIYHPIYKDEFVYKMLVSVCYFCSNLLLSDTMLADLGAVQGEWLKEIYKACRNNVKLSRATTARSCPVCTCPQPAYTATHGGIEAGWRAADVQMLPATLQRQILTAEELDVLTESAAVASSQKFSAYAALRILHNITDETAAKMDIITSLTRPENAIITALYVVPVDIRPPVPVKEGSKSKSTNSISVQYQDIIQLRNAAIEHMTKTYPGVALDNETNPFPDDVLPSEARRYSNELFSTLKGFMEKQDVRPRRDVKAMPNVAAPELKGIRRRNLNDQRSIIARIKGKEGIIRGNMSGKRCNFTARSVITPDTAIDVDEVGIPYEICMVETFPERVNALNAAKLQTRIRLGVEHYDGAKYIIKADGTEISLKVPLHKREQLITELCMGDMVERFITDGDWVILNRQPTLHRNSLVSYKVRRTRGKSIRMNPASCKPFNADFDGDEMNLHFVQDIMSMAELEYLLSVHNNLMGFARSTPALSLIQDTLEAAFFMSQRDTFFEYGDVCRILMQCRYLHKCWHYGATHVGTPCPPDRCLHMDLADPHYIDARLIPLPAIMRPKKLWTGKQLLSVLLPRIYLDMGDVAASEDSKFDTCDKRLYIRNGELISGTFNKNTLGNRHLSVVHIIAKDMGSPMVAAQRAIKYMSDMQRVCGEFMRTFQISVGIDDVKTTDETQETISLLLRAVFDKVARLHHDVDLLTTRVGASTNNDYFEEYKERAIERHIQTLLISSMTKAAAIVETELSRKNSIYTMANLVGSKGNQMNVTQIMCFLGQQILEHQRIHPRGQAPRVLPYYKVGDRNPRANGMITNSFAVGADQGESVSHSIASREGLSDTAVKTAEVGYLSRCLVKGMESVVVCTDNTVRTNGEYDNKQCKIIQFSYAGCNMDTCHLEKVDHKYFLYMSDADISDKLASGPVEAKRLRKYRDSIRVWRLTPLDGAISTRLLVPVDVGRVVNTLLMQRDANHSVAKAGKLVTVDFVLDKIDEFDVHMTTTHGKWVSYFTRASVAFQLSTRRSTKLFGLYEHELESVLSKVLYHVERSRIHYGEAVGVLSAQAISEPALQMTLNTFHVIGQGLNSTSGIKRLKELYSHKPSIQSPMMYIVPAPFSEQRQHAENLRSTIVETFLSAVTVQSLVVELDTWTITHEDEALIRRMTVDMNGAFLSQCKHMLRFELDTRQMAMRKLTPEYVGTALSAYMNSMDTCNGALVVTSDANMSLWVVHAYVVGLPALVANTCKKAAATLAEKRVSVGDIERGVLQQLRADCMGKLRLCGVPNVREAVMRHTSIMKIDPNTGTLVSDDEYVVDTAGSNLMTALTLPGVDWTRLMTNDMRQIHDVLGKHALAKALFYEIKKQLSFEKEAVNDHFIALLINFMTRTSNITKISRSSLNNVDTSNVLDKLTYEDVRHILTVHSCKGTEEKICGASSHTLVGTEVTVGSGMVQLLGADVQQDTAPVGQQPSTDLPDVCVAPVSYNVKYTDAPPPNIYFTDEYALEDPTDAPPSKRRRVKYADDTITFKNDAVTAPYEPSSPVSMSLPGTMPARCPIFEPYMPSSPCNMQVYP